jgi:NADPH:quinone reductase-like Zn-dependent oxidoreductase
MKAIIRREYGSPDVLKLEEIEKPVPNDNQILVRVRAASLNAADGHFMRGPRMMRIVTGLRKPRDIRTGIDVSGTVEAVGKNITRFKAGDDVFGSAKGSLAEYALTVEKALSIKPANITFEQAASVAVAGLTALQGLRKGKIQSTHKVLINGASGGVGTFAVQIAKAFGAEVTGVCSTGNVAMVRSIGADYIIDYTKENFTNSGKRYDLIFDNVSNHSLSERRGVLTPNGICVIAGGGGSGPHYDRMIAVMGGTLKALALSPFISQKFRTFIAKAKSEDLDALRDLMQTRQVVPVIDRTYPLSEVQAAMRYLEEGHARGKVMIAVAAETDLAAA